MFYTLFVAISSLVLELLKKCRVRYRVGHTVQGRWSPVTYGASPLCWESHLLPYDRRWRCDVTCHGHVSVDVLSYPVAYRLSCEVSVVRCGVASQKPWIFICYVHTCARLLAFSALVWRTRLTKVTHAIAHSLNMLNSVKNSNACSSARDSDPSGFTFNIAFNFCLLI